MLPISRILAPVDFSDRCRGVLPYVKAIAERYAAEVTLLHVVETFYTIPSTGFSGPVMIPVPAAAIDARREQMERFAVPELHGLKVQRVVQEGDAATEIVAFAQKEPVSLIAIPTHGYGPLRRFLIGSVTSKVLHDASCPVLTDVHLERPPASGTIRFAKILCAIDFGLQSQEVVAWASQLAADCQAQLSIAHSLASLDPGFPYDSSPQFRMELEALAGKEMQKVQAATKTESAKTHILGGGAAKAIRSLAESIRADLLVIGRGPKDRSGGRLPANAYAIIRQSPCPVISV